MSQSTARKESVEFDKGTVPLSHPIQAVQELFAGARTQAIFFPHQIRRNGERRLKWDKAQVAAFIYLQQDSNAKRTRGTRAYQM